MGLILTIIIGFVAGVIAKFIMPGSNEPSGFVLTTILGIVGAFVATYLGQALGWYSPGEGAGLIGAIVGAIVVLAPTLWTRAIMDRTKLCMDFNDLAVANALPDFGNELSRHRPQTKGHCSLRA